MENNRSIRSISRSEYIYTERPDVFRRLFSKIPEKIFMQIGGIWKIVNLKNEVFDKGVKYCNDPYDLLRMASTNRPSLFEELRKHMVMLVANAIETQCEQNGIPYALFLEGTMSYGFCDKIVFYGASFLGACNVMALKNGLPLINWGKVRISFFVDDIEEVIDAVPKNMKPWQGDLDNYSHLDSKSIVNWPDGMRQQILKINHVKFPLSIPAGFASMKIGEELFKATWYLDLKSIKFKDGKPTSNYFSRPIQMATIKTRKEFAKVFYGPAILGMENIHDGDEDMFELDNSPPFSSSLEAKNRRTAEKLISLGISPNRNDQENSEIIISPDYIETQTI